MQHDGKWKERKEELKCINASEEKRSNEMEKKGNLITMQKIK